MIRWWRGWHIHIYIHTYLHNEREIQLAVRLKDETNELLKLRIYSIRAHHTHKRTLAHINTHAHTHTQSTSREPAQRGERAVQIQQILNARTHRHTCTDKHAHTHTHTHTHTHVYTHTDTTSRELADEANTLLKSNNFSTHTHMHTHAHPQTHTLAHVDANRFNEQGGWRTRRTSCSNWTSSRRLSLSIRKLQI